MANTKAELIQKLVSIATDFENRGNGEQGANIRALIADVNSGKRDHTAVKIKARITVEKFDGEKAPNDGKVPAEVQEFLTEL